MNLTNLPFKIFLNILIKKLGLDLVNITFLHILRLKWPHTIPDKYLLMIIFKVLLFTMRKLV